MKGKSRSMDYQGISAKLILRKPKDDCFVSNTMAELQSAMEAGD